MYVVLRKEKNSFTGHDLLNQDGQVEYRPYGILDNDKMRTLFEVQRYQKDFNITTMTHEHNLLDLGTYGAEIISHDVLVFSHENILIEDSIKEFLKESEINSTNLLKLLKETIYFDDGEFESIVNGMMDYRYQILDNVRNIENIKPVDIVHDVLSRYGSYNQDWRNSQLWLRLTR